MITEQQFKRARATIMRAIFCDGLNYEQVSKLIRDKYGLDYESIAYRMDEEGVFQ